MRGMKKIAPLLCFVTLLVLIAPASTPASVGIEKTSRAAAAPGERVKVTIGCGFCFPPCEGKPARNTPCMLDTNRQPPSRFPLSLVPVERAPKPRRCGPRALCAPQADAPPAGHPYSFLGDALPPPDIEQIRESGRRYVPRYSLEFEVPDLPAGNYVYVIFCETCVRGEGGSLLAETRARPWGLRIRPPFATFSAEHAFSLAQLVPF